MSWQGLGREIDWLAAGNYDNIVTHGPAVGNAALCQDLAWHECQVSLVGETGPRHLGSNCETGD